MSAIWHDPQAPLWLSGGPKFSFVDIAEIVQPAPAAYEEARARLQAWERKFGAAWYQDNARRARELWEVKKPWWLV